MSCLWSRFVLWTRNIVCILSVTTQAPSAPVINERIDRKPITSLHSEFRKALRLFNARRRLVLRRSLLNADRVTKPLVTLLGVD